MNTCPICIEDVTDTIRCRCNFEVCTVCIKRFFDETKKCVCMSCKYEYTDRDLYNMSKSLLRYWVNINMEREIDKELNMCSVYSSLIPSYSNYVSVSTEIKSLLSREEKLKEKLKLCMDKHVVLEIGLMQ